MVMTCTDLLVTINAIHVHTMRARTGVTNGIMMPTKTRKHTTNYTTTKSDTRLLTQLDDVEEPHDDLPAHSSGLSDLGRGGRAVAVTCRRNPR